MTWFCFCFHFILSYVRHGCCSIVTLRFQVLQVKTDWLDTKNTKNINIINNFGQLHTQEFKATKNQVVRIQLNEKKWKESQTFSMSLYWKQKPTWREGLITYNSHPRIMFSFKGLVMIWREGVCFKLDIQSQEGKRISDIVGQRGWRSWKLDSFPGRYMCIIPYFTQCFRRVLRTTSAFSSFATKRQ